MDFSQFPKLAAGLLRGHRLATATALGAAMILSGAGRADAGNMRLQIQQGTDVANVTGTPTSVSASGLMVGDYLISISGGASDTPGTGFNAFLNSVKLTVTRMTDTSSAALFIRVVADGFSDPTGDPLVLGSSGSATFNGLAGDSSFEFLSFFNPTDPAQFGGGIGTSAVTIIDGAAAVTVDRPSPAFALSNVSRIDLRGIGTTVNTTGSTEARGNLVGADQIAPEPASIALLAMGGLGVFGAGWNRRRKHVLARE